MQRFTISLDDTLAHAFDALIAQRGYVNRSEAVRDLIRERLGHAALSTAQATWCVATVSFVHDAHDTALTLRLADLQHHNHDLVVGSQRIPLDHDDALETVVLRGPAAAVQACAAQITALRGVRSGQVHTVALTEAARHRHDHRHGPAVSAPHTHFRPVT